MSFRTKLFLSLLILFIAFILLLIPFIKVMIRHIAVDSLEEATLVLIDLVKSARTEEEMVSRLEKQKIYNVTRVTLLNDQLTIVYDSYLQDFLKDKYVPKTQASHPEIQKALKEGIGVYQGYSAFFKRELFYVAVRFEFHGKYYILRTAYAISILNELLDNFEIGFLVFCAIVLLFFALITWLLFYRFSRPIQAITKAIRAYEIGKEEDLPHISVSPALGKQDDFVTLAETLNALSARIRSQIRHLTDERNEKEAILESLGEGVVAVDSQMEIRYINFIGSKMLGMPKRYLLGKPFPEPEETRLTPLFEKCRYLLLACQESGTVVTDSISIGDLHKRYIDLIAAPKTKGSGAIIVLQDKSSHYRVLEVGKDFVANASHELRTPITIIKGFAETLQDLPELTAEMIRDITEKIVRNCERMDSLVKNLLTLADLENLPESRFHECDLVSLVDNCRHMVQTVYPEARIQVEKNCEEISVSADPDILELAILNLMDNAAKYSSQPAEIQVTLESREEEAKITIGDKGIGIPEADIEHIFERFYTVNKAHSRRLGGAGLGLSIVKTIVERHDGTISVTSQSGQGTTFTILLPIHRYK
jgi:signal transduction histidine kinase